MLPVLGGTVANLSVDSAVREAVAGSGAERLRAVKVCADAQKESLVAEETVPEGDSLAADFQAIAKCLQDAQPCIVLVRLEGDAEWALIGWTPSDSPVKQRMLCASSRKTLKDEFSDLTFKEYNVTEREEVTLEAFSESTKTLTESDRHAAMTQDEIDAEEARKEVAKEQRAAPKMLAGLVALQIKAQGSFEEALERLKAEEGKAILGRLAGPKGEELSGEVLDDVAAPGQLKGRLPQEEPCYVIMRRGEEAWMLLSWLPDGAAVKAKMKCSTFKASVISLVKEMASVAELRQLEVTDEDDLEDSLGLAGGAAADSAAGAEKESAPVSKPPVGGVAMPGMGGVKPPPGAFVLPGLGAGLPVLKKTQPPPP